MRGFGFALVLIRVLSKYKKQHKLNFEYLGVVLEGTEELF